MGAGDAGGWNPETGWRRWTWRAGNPWSQPGRWLRGNLHCHTTNSDGRLSPQETVDWFDASGYQFLALTDHNRITDPASVDPRGLCLLPSTELTAAGGELGGSYHLISLGLAPLAPGEVLPPTTTPVQQSVAWLQARGAVVFIAHPHWSGLTVADLLAVPVAGVEVFNGGTVLDSHKGEALAHWDEGLVRGGRWWGIAVDDTHWHTLDRGLGWINVRAAEATPQAILGAIVRGQFYASAGPQIRQVVAEPEGDDTLRLEVETSPCAVIYALSYGSRNQFAFDREAAARSETGATITHASFRIKCEPLAPGGRRKAQYVRVQCTDWQRRSAWSNPIFLQQQQQDAD